ncbi:hypothetical protein M3Y96_01240700 [Aphelenchoides besseyi]|nr:hypothetical protein M3Y96_01240700 [Aphelenchoides besseyi]
MSIYSPFDHQNGVHLPIIYEVSSMSELDETQNDTSTLSASPIDSPILDRCTSSTNLHSVAPIEPSNTQIDHRLQNEYPNHDEVFNLLQDNESVASIHLNREDDELNFFLLWSLKIGISPTIPLRAIYYAIAVFYMYIGLYRLKTRAEDWDYQRMNEPELWNASIHVPHFIVDLLLFMYIPIFAISSLVLLDLTFTFPEWINYNDLMWPNILAYFFMFTQVVVLIHTFVETINYIFFFFAHVEEIWFWTLILYRLGLFAFYFMMLQFSYSTGYNSRLLKQWALNRYRNYLRLNN